MIVVPVDFSFASVNAANIAFKLASGFKTDLLLFHSVAGETVGTHEKNLNEFAEDIQRRGIIPGCFARFIMERLQRGCKSIRKKATFY